VFPFWEIAIEPVIRASGANRMVEIGALRGETTELMVNALGDNAELHVIDPLPQFDPEEQADKFPGKYIFHRNISLPLLHELPPMDVALVDGDHNWFTVYHELKALAEVASNHDKPMPVLICHDVLWPYGRRDLYYSPEQIPEEFRQPWMRRGIVRGRRRLHPRAGFGINAQLANAVVEGGKRNGVMTGIDDFQKEHPKKLRRVLLPVYFGLLILVEEDELEKRPRLAQALDKLERTNTRKQLLELTEELRLTDIEYHHNYGVSVANKAQERAAERYLNLLKKSLLNSFYIENELRMDHLLMSARRGTKPDRSTLRDPMRALLWKGRELEAKRVSGFPPRTNVADRTAFLPYARMGGYRLDHLRSQLDSLREREIDGDFVVVGTDGGGESVFLRGYLEAWEDEARHVWLADDFRLEEDSVAPTDLNEVREVFSRYDLLDDRVHFLQGEPEVTLPSAPLGDIAMLRLNVEAKQIVSTLKELYPRIVKGGQVIIERGTEPEIDEALRLFTAEAGVTEVIERIDSISVTWEKEEEAARIAASTEPVVQAAPIPDLRRQAKTCDLSVIVVFYNMKREAARTLHSLSRSYQLGLEDVDYEVLVVDNGSAPDQVLGEDYVRSFGPEFRYFELGDDAEPSPVPALNFGVEQSRGDNIGFMIDGAHVLTPGVLSAALTGIATYPPAVITTQQWFVGPGQQSEAIQGGYDQRFEDRLFKEVNWPEDGYRLFNIGHFIGDRDWLDPMIESNCIFVPRTLLEQCGAMDEGFSMAGGGYANLDFYERHTSRPDVKVVTTLGEASFHQVHGGTTTNMPDPGKRTRRLVSYRDHYEDLRGVTFRATKKPLHFVGSMGNQAKRTRPRRLLAPAYFLKANPTGADGRPEQAVPIPEELRDGFTHALYNSMTWENTEWLGQTIGRPSADLMAYQEMVSSARPDWILDVGDAQRAWYLATICEMLGHGQVVSVIAADDDSAGSSEAPGHDRLTALQLDPASPDTIDRLGKLVGDDPNAMLMLSRQNMGELLRLFGLYSPMVGVGQHAVFEDTVVNGHPVWSGYGAGPAEAVDAIVGSREDFVRETRLDRREAGFIMGGVLQRISN